MTNTGRMICEPVGLGAASRARQGFEGDAWWFSKMGCKDIYSKDSQQVERTPLQQVNGRGWMLPAWVWM